MNIAYLEKVWPRNIAGYSHGRYTKNFGLLSPMHFHNGCAEIIQITSGSMLITLPNGKSFTLKDGDIVYFSESCPHETLAELNADMKFLHFDPEWFLKKINIFFSYFPSAENNEEYKFFPVGTEMNKQLSALLDIAEKEKETNVKEYLYGAVFSILGLLIDNRIMQTPGDTDLRLQEKLAPALEYIQKNFREKLSVDDISSATGYNKDYLSRIFKAGTGMTMIDFLNNLRIEEARYLLLNTDKSITEIALEVGFGSNAYLSKLFRKKYTLTPNKYRFNFRRHAPASQFENISDFKFDKLFENEAPRYNT